ncbi:MAG: 2-C-methyl-D-erythritol 4-phosphate cytidylyltransferase [Dermatophilaceae bacterium]|nr:2-C-methyl-D-erythritol 4-phosphate cytidylyltransferase [Intrasporangiaceae bacterium]
MTDVGAASRSVGVVIVAAGSGMRLGAALPKAFVELGGRTLLQRSIEAVLAAQAASLVVVVPAELVRETTTTVDPIVERGEMSVRVVAGGAERTDSVRAGLAALDPRCDVVLVHDAARCLTPVAVFERVIAAVAAGAAGAVPGLPVVDTVKTVDARGVITGTPVRSTLRAIQTPQGFAADVLRDAYASADIAGGQATDDAALVELGGHDVVVVEGDLLAFKITTREDLERAERLLSEGDR